MNIVRGQFKTSCSTTLAVHREMLRKLEESRRPLYISVTKIADSAVKIRVNDDEKVCNFLIYDDRIIIHFRSLQILTKLDYSDPSCFDEASQLVVTILDHFNKTRKRSERCVRQAD